MNGHSSFSRHPKVYSVAALTQRIKAQLDAGFPDIWVEGEVSGVKYHGSGHCYFNLKDAQAQINCTLWRSYVSQLRFRLENGMQVLIQGSIGVYPPRGTYSLHARRIEPRGVGDLQLAFEQLRARLQGEGLFEAERKRPLPEFATRIGIVTSGTAAALQDMLNVIFRRFPNTTVVLSPARVQGEGAAAEIVRAIERLNEYGQVDVIIAGRGGGSIEDLWCFNEEAVARAIAASRIPVVSAVGHEVDFTIADFVADLRAPTPSAAAELVTRNKFELQQQIAALNASLSRALESRIRQRREGLLSLTARLRDPRTRLEDQRRRLVALHDRLLQEALHQLHGRREQQKAVREKVRILAPSRRIEQSRRALRLQTEMLERRVYDRVGTHRRELAVLAGKLDALSPLGVMARGYSIATRQPGLQVIRSAGEVSPGEKIQVQLHRGSLGCVVEMCESPSS